MVKKVNKLTKILLLIAIIFSDLMTPISVLANEITEVTPNKGDIGINNTVSTDGSISVSAGSLTSEGDIFITKTVSHSKDENGNIIDGKYKIEFDIKGKDVVNNIETTKPVYVVVVFDRSGSMQNYCIGNILGTEKEMGTEENCGMLGSLYTLYPKWKNSVLGAKSFANTLLSKIPDAQIALVTFATDTNATPAREFSNTNLDNANFGEPNGGTNLHSGLDKASQLLSSNSIPDNANKYIVVISDGQPTYYLTDNNEVDGPGGSTSKAVLDATYTEANDIKNNKGIEMFTIGYDLPSGTVYSDNTYGSLTAEDILEDVASVDTTEDIEKGITHYLEANPDAVATAFTNIATSISRFEAGTDATLTDNIGSNFKIVGQNGTAYTSEVISKITETGTKISFEVEIDDSKITEAGWYDTNAGFSLVYTDATGTSKTITGNSNPQVYWTPSVYNYTVNYYKDSFNTDAIKSDTREATNGTVINLSNIEKDKYLNNSELGTVGYEFNSISPETITIDSNGKTINILYTIKKFNYTVEFYYDGVLESESTITESDINYGTVVDSTTYHDDGAREGYSLDTANSTSGNMTIDSDNKVIKVYYKKNSYSYTVNYYFNNVIDTDFTKNANALFGSTIKAEDNYLEDSELSDKETEDNTDYFIEPGNSNNTSEITIGTNSNELNIYYINTIVTDENIEKSADTSKITSGDTPITYTVNYTSIVNNVKKGDTVKVVITDTLPLEIYTKEENENIDLNGGVYDASSKTITWTFETTMDEFTKEYDASKTISYTVVYKNVGNGDGSSLINRVVGNTTAGGKTTTNKVDSSTVDVEIPAGVIVHHVEKGTTNKVANDETLTGTVGESYITNYKTDIFGYTVDTENLPNNKTGKYTEDTIEVTYYYTKNNGNIENTNIVKTSTNKDKKVESVDGTISYTITATGKVTDYVGNVTIKVVDTPSNIIDREKSVLGEGCAITGDREITCTKTVTIDEENYVNGVYNVNETFIMDLVFKDIDSETVTNSAKVEIILDDSKITDEDTDTEEVTVEKGKVTAIYVDEEDNELENKEESSDLVGKEYSTQAKDIFGYTLTKEPDNRYGIYTKEDIIVKYIYSKNAGTVDETTVVKTADSDTVESVDETISYTITATGKVTDYIGDVTIKVVDTPSNIIDREKSVLGKGCTITGDREITCTKTVTIDEEDYVNGVYNVNETFIMDLVFKDIDSETVTNSAKVEIILDDSKIKDEDTDTEEVEVFKGTVVATYKDTEGNVLHENITTTGLAGTEYETEEKEFFGYTLSDINGNDSEGLYLANQTLTVNYIYSKNDGTITGNTLVKDGPSSVTSVDETFDYIFKYDATVTGYTGNVTLKITDTLPFDAFIISKDNRCTYDDNRTITCVENYNITSDTVINETFNVSIKYTNISFNDINTNTTLTNQLVAELTYGDSKVTNSASKETIVNVGSVVATYKDTEGNVLHENITTTGLAGTEYETEEKEFFGYTLTTTPNNKTGKYASNQTITVEYIYSKNTGTVDETTVVKTADSDTVESIDETINYTITATGKVTDYVGNVTIKVVDTPSNIIDREKSVLGEGCTITGDREITCTKTVTIDEEDYVNGVYNVNETFIMDLVFKDIDSETVTNSAKVEIILDDSKITDEDTDTEEVKVEKGKITVTYKDTLGNTLSENITMTDLAGTKYLTETKEFYGYTLVKLPENKEGTYLANQNIIVDYVYSKNVGTSEEELSKIGAKEVANMNSAFDYKITYNTIIKDYVGEAALVITDELPYEIDIEKSMIGNVCKYNDGKLVCTYKKNITKEDNEFNIEENFTLYYVNVVDNKVTNKVKAELTYGETTKTNNSEYTTEVNKGTVIVDYVTKDGTKLTESVILTGMVGDSYITDKKIFDQYSFIEVKGEVEGIYTNDTIYITYVYDITPLPPQTGVEFNPFMFVKYLLLAAFVIVGDKTYKLVNNN